jgi:hypothetical protein
MTEIENRKNEIVKEERLQAMEMNMGKVVEDQSADEIRTFGDFLQEVRWGGGSRLKTREVDKEGRALNMGVGAQGGFLVPEQFDANIRMVDDGAAIIRPRAQVIPAGSPPDAAITIPALDQSGARGVYSGVTVDWIAEGDTKPESEPRFREIKLEPQEVAAVATKAGEPYRPTIQDRLNEKTSETIGEIEGVYDEVSTGQKADFKPYDFLTINKVPQSQLGKYEAVFTKRKAELEEAQAKVDPQLKEAYSHLKAADFKRLITWIDNLLAGIEQYRGVKKATKKAAVRKAPSKEKLVAKLKYAKEDRALKVVSVNPADIIGASELWVYNTKTRKLGKYVSVSYQTLNIKGTTITGYDEDKSVAKTLRKPDEQLKEFARAGKVALRTWIKDIKAVEIKLTGRINEDTLLLKVG